MRIKVGNTELWMPQGSTIADVRQMMKNEFQVRYFVDNRQIGLEQFRTFRGAYNFARDLQLNNPSYQYGTIVEQIIW